VETIGQELAGVLYDRYAATGMAQTTGPDEISRTQVAELYAAAIAATDSSAELAARFAGVEVSYDPERFVASARVAYTVDGRDGCLQHASDDFFLVFTAAGSCDEPAATKLLAAAAARHSSLIEVRAVLGRIRVSDAAELTDPERFFPLVDTATADLNESGQLPGFPDGGFGLNTERPAGGFSERPSFIATPPAGHEICVDLLPEHLKSADVAPQELPYRATPGPCARP
jgi:hypothetical protein